MEETSSNNARTLVSLRDYMDSRLSAIEKAIEVANTAMDRRLNTMNEFRDALRDQGGQMATRAELRAVQEKFDVELRGLREFRVALEAKASQQAVNLALLLALLGVAISVIGLILSAR